MEIIPMTIYTVLFLVALIPPLLGKRPFTYYIAKGGYPEVITQSEPFAKITNHLSYAWAVLFALAFVLVQIEYSPYSGTNVLISNAIAALPQILIGIPLNILYPKYFMKKPTSKIHFNSMAEAFEAMEFGLNKEVAKGVDIVVQFELSGEEAGVSHIIIKDGKYSYHNTLHENPTLTIKTDSDIWLEITNGERFGAQEVIEGRVELIGDASIMQYFEKLFDQSATLDIIDDRVQDYLYHTMVNKKIEKIVVFDGGARNKKLSKTTLMVDKFVQGAEFAGAQASVYKLSELDIHRCDGCYTCWTKTPGECVHKDIMDELRLAYRSADLVVFASPLYIFNVTGTMKNFMDRLLPILKPYMLLDEHDGHILHPDRFPEYGEQAIVVMSASGFPDIDNNFDGLKAMYRTWASHSENTHLMGEFFLPAAELLAQPIYADRKKIVEQACFEAGIQAVREGQIDYTFMKTISNPRVSHKTFQAQADTFWASMEGKKGYLRVVPKL